ncbi:hypothetical protein FH609_004230 [Streptomyces sp. 3MP-14]|uniref:Uncharacterized protein n=1 Tax=Streptomyces mimosae TaxID=2586635 RepID=A0A5N6A5E6_9ACTN|nr:MULTISPECIES: hypothetical protein [Streptomyces]KAB8162940.1 hypothetical protein FH607_020090 [Streptomyces mimosae]KAB8179154.1 hypothetical protein FH609_004230 [Streptomyces sp. 3MP-14]
MTTQQDARAVRPGAGAPRSHHTTNLEDQMASPTRIQRRCEQCGRTGTRQFRVLPAVPPIIVCVNRAACRRRWPRPVIGEAA